MMFRDQVGVLASWFKGWNECEQTVALLSLLKRVSRTQARFLQLCLEHSLAECTELQVLEGEANNPGRTAIRSDTFQLLHHPLRHHEDAFTGIDGPESFFFLSVCICLLTSELRNNTLT
ncbi:hypothetical protein PFLUV_G00036000 [Perca fluviatilis]|uniref:RNA-binding protein vts1-like alpha-helical domain-containing protein n=1 Tax=Perca fluviatilis TaxID=8168 RepID=A0A6A5FD47_PERFL|nr:hypothetical protein PFLUV_G00036000 [Perca fluviatilis]